VTTADGVMVPPELCRALSRLAVLGLAEQARRDGGLYPAPGLAELLSELSARGHAPATLEARAVSLGSGAAAEVIGCAARSARRLAAAGVLRAERAGRDWRIDRDSAEDYARRRRSAA